MPKKDATQSSTSVPKVLSSKEKIYEVVQEYVKSRTEKNIGRSGGQEIFNRVVECIFAAAAHDGVFRFNGGFGSLHIRTYKPGKRRIPSGAEVSFGERRKIRLEEGLVVKALVANQGDLEKAKKAKGTKSVSGPSKDDPTEPAKADAKKPANPVRPPVKPAKDPDASHEVDLD